MSSMVSPTLKEMDAPSWSNRAVPDQPLPSPEYVLSGRLSVFFMDFELVVF